MRESYYLGHHRDMILQITHLYILDALKNKSHNSNIQHIITAWNESKSLFIANRPLWAKRCAYITCSTRSEVWVAFCCIFYHLFVTNHISDLFSEAKNEKLYKSKKSPALIRKRKEYVTTRNIISTKFKILWTLRAFARNMVNKRNQWKRIQRCFMYLLCNWNAWVGF